MSIARKVKRGGGPKVGELGAGMVFIPGGEFTMGSDHHYAEEKPAHRVKLDGFWIDASPVTNAQFRRFVRDTGHVTFAEVAPEPKDYPGALPHMLRAGSLVFVKSKGPVDLKNWSNWWTFGFGADWRHPYGPGSSNKGLDNHPVVHISYRGCRGLREMGRQGTADRGRMGVRGARRPGGRGIRLGRRVHAGRRYMANTWQGEFPRQNLLSDGHETHLAGRHLSAERLRPLRHDRQCLGMDHGLVFAKAQRGPCQGLLHAAEPARRARGAEL